MLCTASVKYSKKHSNDSSVTDMYQICDIKTHDSESRGQEEAQQRDH